MPFKCDSAKKKASECSCKEPPSVSSENSQERSTVRLEGYLPNLSTVSKKRNVPDPNAIFGPGFKKTCVSLVPRKKAPCAKIYNSSPVRRTCIAGEQEPLTQKPPCIYEEKKAVKPLKKKADALSGKQCKPCRTVKTPCGQEPTSISGRPAKIFALEKTLSRTQWQDEEGYHSASVTMSQIYSPENQFDGGTKSCASEKRRNYLRAKLRELMGDTRPIPEGGYPEGSEAKPEPEVVAAALLMSEGESTDLGKTRPDNVFQQLFSNSSPDRSVALASAAPEPMNSVVIPLTVQSRKPPSLDVPNSEKILQKARGVSAPNPNVFQESDTYEHFPEYVKEEIVGRSPAVVDVSSYLGTPLSQSNAEKSDAVKDDWDEGILEYVIRPEPPSYRNRVRLNGSVRPSWFPGYVVVSPLIPDYLRLSNNSGDALRDAWCLCRPRHFDDLSKSLVNIG